MNIPIKPQTIFNRLLFFITFLFIINLIGLFSKYSFEYDYYLIPLFDFNTERNIPTLYSSFALIISAVLLFVIAWTHKRFNRSYLMWSGLAVIFLYLSIDEIASIHEKLTTPTQETLHTSEYGLFRNAWIIPYGIALLVFVLTYIRFLLNLPKKIKLLFVLSGTTFIFGAIGLESIGGIEVINNNSLLYLFINSCEEYLEMLGIIIFIYTLLSYLTSEYGTVTFTIKAKN